MRRREETEWQVAKIQEREMEDQTWKKVAATREKEQEKWEQEFSGYSPTAFSEQMW